MNGDPSGSSQAWNESSSYELRPTSMTIEEATAECEKFFFRLFPDAPPSTIKNTAKEATVSLSTHIRCSEATKTPSFLTQASNEELLMSSPSGCKLVLSLALTPKAPVDNRWKRCRLATSRVSSSVNLLTILHSHRICSIWIPCNSLKTLWQAISPSQTLQLEAIDFWRIQKF